MKSARSKWIHAACAGVVLLAGALATQAAEPVAASVPSATAPGAAAQADRSGGVTVKVTPRELGRGATAWEFVVSLDTHSQDLSQDLARSAVLIDPQGKRYPALGWEGAGPGGHHREGVLRFKPLAPEADAVVLEMSGIGSSSVRTFRWQLK